MQSRTHEGSLSKRPRHLSECIGYVSGSPPLQDGGARKVDTSIDETERLKHRVKKRLWPCFRNPKLTDDQHLDVIERGRVIKGWSWAMRALPTIDQHHRYNYFQFVYFSERYGVSFGHVVVVARSVMQPVFFLFLLLSPRFHPIKTTSSFYSKRGSIIFILAYFGTDKSIVVWTFVFTFD